MIEQINDIAEIWWGWMWPMFWQASVLIALVAIVDLFLRRRAWPQLRYALWLLVLLKLVLPPTLSLPTSVTSGLSSLSDKVVPQVPVDQTFVQEPMELPPTIAPFDLETVAASEGAGENPPILSTGAAAPVTPVVSIPPAEAGLSWRAYAMLIWAVGATVLGLWLVIMLRRMRRVYCSKETLASTPQKIMELVASTARKLKLGRLPAIAVSDKITSPAVFGVLKPVLLLPADSIESLSRDELQHVLLHELAHIKRGDMKLHAVNMTLQIIYWFNPLLRVVRRQLQHLRELCCDATVANILRERTSEYRETLLETARRLLAKPVPSGIGLLGLFENSSRLLIRLKWLEKNTWKRRWLRVVTICAVVTVMTACVLPMARAAQKPTDERPELKEIEKSEEKESVNNNFKATLPSRWKLTYDDGTLGEKEGGAHWKSGMATNLSQLRAIPTPANEYDESWKKERLSLEIRTLDGKQMGNVFNLFGS